MGRGVARWNLAHIAAPRVCQCNVPFLVFLCPDMNAERGVAIYMYLKDFSEDSDSKWIVSVGLTHYVQVLFPKYYFWHF